MKRANQQKSQLKIKIITKLLKVADRAKLNLAKQNPMAKLAIGAFSKFVAKSSNL